MSVEHEFLRSQIRAPRQRRFAYLGPEATFTEAALRRRSRRSACRSRRWPRPSRPSATAPWKRRWRRSKIPSSARRRRLSPSSSSAITAMPLPDSCCCAGPGRRLELGPIVHPFLPWPTAINRDGEPRRSSHANRSATERWQTRPLPLPHRLRRPCIGPPSRGRAQRRRAERRGGSFSRELSARILPECADTGRTTGAARFAFRIAPIDAPPSTPATPRFIMEPHRGSAPRKRAARARRPQAASLPRRCRRAR